MAIIIIKSNIANPPHKGAVTHHQDQSITLVNFNVMNIKNIRPKKPIPPELLFSDIYFNLKSWVQRSNK